jgi:hypothetical protein
MSKTTERTVFEEKLLERNKSRVNVNSEESRCQCCGKSESEIRAAFEKLYCQGKIDKIPEYLFNIGLRPFAPYDHESEMAFVDAKGVYKDHGFDDPLEYMCSKYGEKEGNRMYAHSCAYHQLGEVLDCLFCWGLDDEEFFEIRRERRFSRL